MIIMVFGLPGSGKSYFARHLKQKTGAAYFNTDMIREELDLKGIYNERSKQLVYDRLVENVTEELDKDLDVIVDGTFHKQKRRDILTGVARKKNKRINLIEIRASEETIIKRLKSTRKYSEADYEVYIKIKKEFEPEYRNHLVLWSDAENTSEMITKAKHYIYGYQPGSSPYR